MDPHRGGGRDERNYEGETESREKLLGRGGWRGGKVPFRR